MKTYFIGGARDGHLVEVGDKPTNEYHDIATATTYRLQNLTFNSVHPVTGKPDRSWTKPIYVHKDIPNDAAMWFNLIAQHIVRDWLQDGGAVVDPSEPHTSNGKAPMWYYTECACHGSNVFGGEDERAAFITTHAADEVATHEKERTE